MIIIVPEWRTEIQRAEVGAEVSYRIAELSCKEGIEERLHRFADVGHQIRMQTFIGRHHISWDSRIDTGCLRFYDPSGSHWFQ